jgi:ribosomal protein L14E/L6E/L27E
VEVVKGSLVKARAGRDKDSLFVAVGICGGFVYICDGKSRPLERPKRKNPKHISPAGAVIDTDELTNKKLRRLISQYLTQADSQQTENL